MVEFRWWGLVDWYNPIILVPVCFCLFSVSGTRIDAAEIFHLSAEFLVGGFMLRQVEGCRCLLINEDVLFRGKVMPFTRFLSNGIQWLAFRHGTVHSWTASIEGYLHKRRVHRTSVTSFIQDENSTLADLVNLVVYRSVPFVFFVVGTMNT